MGQRQATGGGVIAGNSPEDIAAVCRSFLM